jgi:4,5-dihydroxyphthalate decarboxylase
MSGNVRKSGARKGTKLKLKVIFSDNPRLLPLIQGIVKPEHIELEFENLSASKLFFRNLAEGMKTHVSEMSISETLLARERKDLFGEGRWDWSPIPIFLSRGLFWSDIYVNNNSGINSFGDLKGKKISIPDYGMTAALWFRILLKDLYGIEARDNLWYQNRTKELSHAGMVGLDREGHGVARDVALHFLPVDQAADILLDRGEIDASFPFSTTEGVTVGNRTVIDRYGGTPLTDNPHFRKLIDDEGKKNLVFEFFRKTGCHMPNHHVIIRNDVLAEHPWVAMELFEALKRSKEVAYEQAKQARSAFLYLEADYWREYADVFGEGTFPIGLPALRRLAEKSSAYLEEQRSVFGEDPFPQGLSAMRKTIERAVRGSLEQGLITKPIRLEDLYHPSTLDA